MKHHHRDYTPKDTNDSVLREAEQQQSETLEVLMRTRRRVSETKDVGRETLATINEQKETTEGIKTAMHEVKTGLKKAGKQMNKFCALGLDWGNEKRARKAAKAETKKGESPRKGTFKRRGPRPKKDPPKPKKEQEYLFDPKEIHFLPSAGKRTKKTNATQSTRTVRTSNETKSRGGASLAPVREEDKRRLREIKHTDKVIDEGLDALCEEVEDLKEIAQTMKESVAYQKKTLEAMDNELANGENQTKILNKRIGNQVGGRSKASKNRNTRAAKSREMAPTTKDSAAYESMLEAMDDEIGDNEDRTRKINKRIGNQVGGKSKASKNSNKAKPRPVQEINVRFTNPTKRQAGGRAAPKKRKKKVNISRQ